jgi:hypothetical protein
MPLCPNSLVRFVPARLENFEHEEKFSEVATFLQTPGIGTNSSGGATSDLAIAHPISQLLGLSIGLVKKCIPHWLRIGLGKARLATRYEGCAPNSLDAGS